MTAEKSRDDPYRNICNTKLADAQAPRKPAMLDKSRERAIKMCGLSQRRARARGKIEQT